MTSAWNCENKRHQGERFVQHPTDRFEVRLEYRSADGRVRAHNKTLRHMCRRCMEGEWRDLNADPVGFEFDQGTLL